MDFVTRLTELIAEGKTVLSTARFTQGLGTRVDSSMFTAWQARTAECLSQFLPNSNYFVINFHKEVIRSYDTCVKIGVKILESLKEDSERGIITFQASERVSVEPVEQLRNIFKKFHQVVRQIRVRHDKRATLDVVDEYDVQDLLHSLLFLYFDDVRAEEWSPSYAGGASRMDFVLKQEQIVIEVKRTRTTMKAKDLGEQLIIDIERYKVHPDCKTLVCFVYDPEGYIANPRGIENDLNRTDGAMPVQVYIRPV
ncbi:MAG: hypothetical protein WCC10_09390 [Tumebacillaceae bacterium]